MTFSFKAFAAAAIIALAAPAFAHGGGPGGTNHMPSMTQTQTKMGAPAMTNDRHGDTKTRDTRRERELAKSIGTQTQVLLRELAAATLAHNSALTGFHGPIWMKLQQLDQRALQDGVKVTVTAGNYSITIGAPGALKLLQNGRLIAQLGVPG